MATGFSRTIEAGHEPFYDCTCCSQRINFISMFCSKQGRNVEAIKYCVECCEYMCNECLIQHDQFSPLRTHRMLEGAEMTAQGQHNQPSFPTKRCEVHNGELFTTFCHTHDAVCCSTCVALDHRFCILDLIHLTKAAKGVKDSREYKDIKVSMKMILTNLGKLRNARQNDKTRLEKDTQNVEASIQDFRKKVYKIIDDLEKATTNHLRAKHKEYQGRINADIKTLEELITTVEVNTKRLENTQEENESEIFVSMKQIKITLRDRNDVIRNISRGDGIEKIQFNLNSKIEEYLKSLRYFGDFLEISQPVPHSPMRPTDTSAKQQPDQSRRSSAKQTTGTSSKQPPDQNRLYSAKQHSQVNVSVNTDRITSNILGSCQLQDGTILIVDSNNDKIKRLDASYAVSDYCDVPGGPYAVCCTGPREVAVSLLRVKQIQFVSVGNKLSLNNSFSVGVACRGVAYTNGELYVSCNNGEEEGPGHVRVYNKAGKLLHTIQSDMFGRAIFTCPLSITASADESFIYIADNSNGLITLNSSGQVVSTVQCPELSDAIGICVDNRDQVLVCGYNTNNIFQLGRNGDILRVILTVFDGITNSRSICYDRRNSRLIVTTDDSGIIKVFDLV